jgi:cytochrome c553
MKKLPAASLPLLIGIGIGFLITKSVSSGDSAIQPESTSPNRDTPSNLRTGPSSRTSPAGKPASGRTASSPRSLAALLELTGDRGNGQDSIAFLQAVERLGADEIAAMMTDFKNLDPTDARRYQLSNALINRWAAIDPDGAWDAVLNLDDKNLKRQMIASVIGAISRSDLGKARQLLSEIKDPPSKQHALYAYLNHAASEDPEEAFRVLASESTNSQNYSHYQTLFQKWAKDDPEAAIAKLDSIKGASNRQQALQGITAALVTSDPQRALALLDGMPSGQNRGSMLSSITSAWMRHDSDAAIAWINSLPPADKSKALQNGCYQLIQEDPAKAAKLLSSLPSNNQTSHQFSNLASQWAQQDLEAARKWAESLPPGQSRERAMSGILSTLSRTDPAKAAAFLSGTVVTNQNASQVGMVAGEWIKTDQTAALAWLDSLDLRGDALQYANNQFMSTWVNEDAAAASRYALGIQDEKAREQAIGSLIGTWANNDPVAARAWIMTSLEGDAKNRSLNSLIQNLSYQDHATAVQYYQEATANLAPETIEKTFGSTASQITRYWAQHDPKAAGQWVMSLPEGDSRSNSVQSLVDQLGDNDIKGAAEFINTLAVGKERDQAVGALVSDLRNQGDPESAFDWAASVSDASKRENMIRTAANQWKDYDPAAARAAVTGADISKETKTSILKSLGN